MAIDITRERLLTLTEAAKLLPSSRKGKAVNASTIWRWMHRGSNDVLLDGIKMPSGWHTSAEALQRFFDELSRKADNGRRQPSDTDIEAAAEAAGRELERRFGI